MNRADRRALERVTGQTRSAGGIAPAQELDELRRVRTGSYALMHALVSRMGGGPIEIPRGEWQALPPGETLKVVVDKDTNDVRLFIEKAAAG